MPKQTIKKIEKQIRDSNELLKVLELRPCQGDKDLKQKDIEIDELKAHITSLEKERDGYLFSWQNEKENDQNQ